MLFSEKKKRGVKPRGTHKCKKKKKRSTVIKTHGDPHVKKVGGLTQNALKTLREKRVAGGNKPCTSSREGKGKAEGSRLKKEARRPSVILKKKKKAPKKKGRIKKKKNKCVGEGSFLGKGFRVKKSTALLAKRGSTGSGGGEKGPQFKGELLEKKIALERLLLHRWKYCGGAPWDLQRLVEKKKNSTGEKGGIKKGKGFQRRPS